MTRPTAMVSIFTLTGLNTKATGKMTSNMARGMRRGLMEASSMATMSIQRKRAREFTHGLTEISISVTGKTTPFPEMASMSGTMAGSMSVNGKTM